MSRTMIAAIILLMGALVAVAIVAHDSPSDDGGADGVETDGDDQVFQEPFVNDPDLGHVEMTYDSPYVTFSAVPSPGYSLMEWQRTADGSTYAKTGSVTMHIDEIVQLTAVFGTYGNVVVEYDWNMPVFGEDGSVTYQDEIYATAVSGSDFQDVRNDPDIPRRAANGVYVPSDLVVADSEAVKIAAYLDSLTEGMSQLQRSYVLMCFVQDVVTYQTDQEQYGTVEYWATPIETMYSGYGDCEDGSILFCAVAGIMGLDAGLVAFDYVDAGHMSVAVALEDGSDVDGGAKFAIDGTTYVYVETADSGRHIEMGFLMQPYDIGNGKWTKMSYDPETMGYTASETVLISTAGIVLQLYAVYGSDTPVYDGGPIFGDAFSDPPAVEMSVDDTFTYVPETNMESVITASGPGMASEGGFLTWDPETGTLSGTPDAPGRYTVVLEAVWSSSTLMQTAHQNIEIVVSGQSGANSDVELSYGSEGWSVSESPRAQDDVPVDDGADDADDGDALLYAVIGVAAVLAVFVVARRFF